VGEITIKIPQKIHRSYQIDSPEYAEEIIQDLNRHSSDAPANGHAGEGRLENLRKLVESYRLNPDAETRTAVDIANDWRERWNG